MEVFDVFFFVPVFLKNLSFRGFLLDVIYKKFLSFADLSSIVEVKKTLRKDIKTAYLPACKTICFLLDLELG